MQGNLIIAVIFAVVFEATRRFLQNKRKTFSMLFIICKISELMLNPKFEE